MYSYNLLNSLQSLTAKTDFSLTLSLITTTTQRCASLPSYQAQNCPYVGSLFREDEDEVASVFKPLPTLLEFCLGMCLFWMCLIGTSQGMTVVNLLTMSHLCWEDLITVSPLDLVALGICR